MRKHSKKLMLAKCGVTATCMVLVTSYASIMVGGLMSADGGVGEITQIDTFTAEQPQQVTVEAVAEIELPKIATNRSASEVQKVETTTLTGGTCQDWMKQAGIVDTANAYELIMRESSCNPNSVNKSSGACGIGQQLPCGKWEHKWNDPVGGMIDMQKYVLSRYGSWANAVSFHNAHHWY